MQTIIEKPKLKMSEAQKVALFCGLFILLVMILVLIDGLLFYDTNLIFQKEYNRCREIAFKKAC